MERVASVRVATPALTSSDPRVAEPSRNVTRPLAVDGDKVAVRTTLCPAADGFADEVSVIVVAMGFTVCVKVFEILPPLFGSPL